jgi:glycopeptide antibiotics resistance protein
MSRVFLKNGVLCKKTKAKRFFENCKRTKQVLDERAILCYNTDTLFTNGDYDGDNEKNRHLCVITLSLYMLLLVWIIALKCNMRDGILDAKIYNRGFTLSERFVLQLSRFSKTSPREGALNALIFIPLGMLIPFLINKLACLKTVLYCFFISSGFAILQVINCIGRFTYIDIINNTIGGMIGALVYCLLRKKLKENSLAVTFSILICVLLPMLIAATVNTVNHIDYYL